MKIPESTVQRIRDATDIVELISGYVQLKQRGQNHWGLCPFHTEKTPSFSVNRDRQIFHCFGCGKGGDAFRFLMDHERMGFLDAVRMLGERAHVDIPRSDPAASDRHDRMARANAVAAEYFQTALRHANEGAPARAYLAGRGIPEAMWERFAVGYAPGRTRGLIRYAERHQVTVRDLETAGLTIQRQGRPSDRFTQRLMFPIRNLSGRPIAFGGRDLSGSARAKYLNSPETELYHKGRVLYGLYESRRALSERKAALLCEGYTDTLRLHEFGFEHAVAASGTALTVAQARLLARYVETVYLLFDADGPGRDAALRSVPVLYDAGLDVRVVSLPGGHDPDDFLPERGADALTGALEGARDYVEFLESVAGAPFGHLPLAQQSRLVDEVAGTVARMQDPVRRDLLSRAAWSRFGIDETLFRSRVGRSRGDPAPASGPSASTVPADWRTELLGLLLQDREARTAAARLIAADDFEQPLQRSLLNVLLREDALELEVAELLRTIDNEKVAGYAARLAALTLPDSAAHLAAYLTKLEHGRLRRQSNELVQQIRAAERARDTERVARLSLEHQRLQSRRLRLDRRPGDPAGEARESDP